MALSDRIALLRDGTLEQIASPREIYAHPATAYTAEFIGQTNLLRGEIRAGTATCGALRWRLEGSDGPALFSLLEVDCGGGQALRVRIPAHGVLSGQHDFVFSPADAIRVRDA